jgi:hypothetical protein
MMHATEVEPEILARAKALFDARLSHVEATASDAAELDHFYWFVRSDKFEPEWWLPRLAQVLELHPAFDPKGQLGECLASAAAVNPELALAAVRGLYRKGSQPFDLVRYDIVENATPAIIATALDSGDSALAKRASDLMNLLGSEGYLELESKVSARRNLLSDELTGF